jgi:REP element-mobilizing transposase RayT
VTLDRRRPAGGFPETMAFYAGETLAVQGCLASHSPHAHLQQLWAPIPLTHLDRRRRWVAALATLAGTRAAISHTATRAGSSNTLCLGLPMRCRGAPSRPRQHTATGCSMTASARASYERQNARQSSNQRSYMCVMPNHVHVVAEQIEGFRLCDVVQAWKSTSAHLINRHLQRPGRLWRREYFDRFMRDDDHLGASIAYVEENPVRAKLVARAVDWRWSSARFRQNAAGEDAGGPRP